MQVVGAGIAIVLVRTLFPTSTEAPSREGVLER
jgi:hypothetical protein